MDANDPRHGTYAGAMAHRRDNEQLCFDCLEAQRSYMRIWRHANPEKVAEQGQRNNAMSRALWRLAIQHPDEFDAYVDEEMSSS